MITRLYELIKNIWTHERMPKAWEMGVICPLYKKGDILCCENYIGITLLSTGYKVLSNIICGRIQSYLEKIIGKYQCGFMKEKPVADQMFIIRQILEKTHEYDIPTFHLFVDFKLAYDSIIRDKLYAAMRELGIPKKLACMTRATMCCVRGVVKVEGKISREFEITSGLKQGDGSV